MPGQRLIEIDLMNELNISRGNIRDAFRSLESEGIISIEKHRGASVRKITRAEAEDTFELLAAISMATVKKVALISHESKIREALEQSLADTIKFREELQEHQLVQDYMEENCRFWGVLSILADNRVMEDTRNRLQTPLYRLQIQGMVINSYRQKWISLHEEILTSLLAGDTGAAISYTAEAQQDALQAILALPDSAYMGQDRQ